MNEDKLGIRDIILEVLGVGRFRALKPEGNLQELA
jgi:hypothetical protein